MAKTYPDKPRGSVLSDLVQLTPGDDGKWFAAAKDARLFDEAVPTRTRALFDDPAARSEFVASVIGKEMGLD